MTQNQPCRNQPNGWCDTPDRCKSVGCPFRSRTLHFPEEFARLLPDVIGALRSAEREHLANRLEHLSAKQLRELPPGERKDKIRFLEIAFPFPVEVTREDEIALDAVATTICERYERANPDRVMWPAGHGYKMLSNPFLVTDDEPLEFDEETIAIDVAERERYDSEKKQ